MRLPLRDAARMSILSSEWRCKWLTIPDLVFDEDHLPKRKSPMDHVRIVDRTLWNHFGPIYKFSCNLSNINSKDLSRWIAKLRWNEIKQLILIPKWGLEVVPNTLFYCQGLCYLELYCCKLELHPLLKGFPSLTHLNLRDMYMPEDTLAGLISNCPLLERLTLKGHGSYLKVDAPNLRYLDVRGAFRDIWIESSPLLVDVSVNLWLLTRKCIKKGHENHSLIRGFGCSHVIERLSVMRSLSMVTMDHLVILNLSLSVYSSLIISLWL